MMSKDKGGALDRALMIGTSLYKVNRNTGRVDHQLSGRRSLISALKHNAFLSTLPKAARDDLLGAAQRKVFYRSDVLRGSSNSTVHIVVGGCVTEESTYGETTTVRILGAGAVLGDQEVLSDSVTPTTRCLNTTWTLTIPLERMRMIAEYSAPVAMALGAALADRIATAERVYHRTGLRPEERLAGLFVHLLDTCAIPNRDFGRMLEGLSQSDLADALCVSKATIETAIRTLRHRGLVVTGYRSYEFPSERALAELGKVRIPAQRVTGEASAK
ncbi:Crp/Fnr family transcriptional regulator [Streptomyces sp. NPDC058657]|uniref:Crp/Fnr family transcriptional regulator n=1 Tax=unclassified Streptomyces TaxID=2593676 RepID=UPI0036639B80